MTKSARPMPMAWYSIGFGIGIGIANSCFALNYFFKGHTVVRQLRCQGVQVG